MLNGKRRHCRSSSFRRNRETWDEAIRESCLLDREIEAHQVQLLVQPDFVFLGATENETQHIAQLLDDPRRRCFVALAHEHGNGVEAIEKKVWIQPGLQRSEAGAGQLL